MDLEKNSVSLVGPPTRASTSKNLAANVPLFNNNSLFASLNTSTNFQSGKKFTPRALLKRSLSHSARVLTTKANQLRGQVGENQSTNANTTLHNNSNTSLLNAANISPLQSSTPNLQQIDEYAVQKSSNS